MTEQFVSAAELMASVLGAPDIAFATIEHPISSASADQLAVRAAAAARYCADVLTGSSKT